MNTKSVSDMWWIIVGLIIFVVSALIFYTIFFRFIMPIQQSLSDSVCKFEVALRAVLVGNPIVQMLTGVFGFFTRGFASISAGMFSGLTLQSCTQGISLQTTPTEPLVGYEVETIFFKKVGDESARCWDIFGAGNWDSLLFAPGGLSFTCWRDIFYARCPPDSETGANLLIGSSAIQDYLRYNEYSFGSYSELYYDLFPNNMPIMSSESKLTCDGQVHKYIASLDFVDKLLASIGSPIIALLCDTVKVDSLASDSLYLCILDLGVVSGGA